MTPPPIIKAVVNTAFSVYVDVEQRQMERKSMVAEERGKSEGGSIKKKRKGKVYNAASGVERGLNEEECILALGIIAFVNV